jgi:hypothetical protein
VKSAVLAGAGCNIPSKIPGKSLLQLLHACLYLLKVNLGIATSRDSAAATAYLLLVEA